MALPREKPTRLSSQQVRRFFSEAGTCNFSSKGALRPHLLPACSASRPSVSGPVNRKDSQRLRAAALSVLDLALFIEDPGRDLRRRRSRRFLPGRLPNKAVNISARPSSVRKRSSSSLLTPPPPGNLGGRPQSRGSVRPSAPLRACALPPVVERATQHHILLNFRMTGELREERAAEVPILTTHGLTLNVSSMPSRWESA